MKLEFRFKYNSALTNATSVVLCDSTNAYGVKRLDTDDILVVANTAMTAVSTGVYQYDLDFDVDAKISYWVKVVFNSTPYYFEKELTVTSTETDSAESDPIDAALSNPKSFASDGQSVEQHSLKDLIEADKYKRSRDAASSGAFGGIRYGKFIPPGSV